MLPHCKKLQTSVHKDGKDIWQKDGLLKSSDSFLQIRTLHGLINSFNILAGSYEQSPGLMAELEQWSEPTAPVQSHVVDDRLRETLADAMLESPVKDNIGIGRYSKRDMWRNPW